MSGATRSSLSGASRSGGRKVGRRDDKTSREREEAERADGSARESERSSLK
jgi:hypothetical protein